MLINPGSAKPVADTDDEVANHLSTLTGLTDSWQQFSPDSTMGQLAKIFSGWYAGKDIPLNGCILLFNLFNLRDKNLAEAVELQKACGSEHLFSTENDLRRLENVDKIYLGWGNTGKYQLRQYAEPIFDAVKAKCTYLNSDFNSNAFYHPGYINRSYNRNPTTKRIVKEFLS